MLYLFLAQIKYLFSNIGSNNSNVTNGRMNHELKNGVCMPNEKITIDANVLNNDNVYKDSQVQLWLI